MISVEVDNDERQLIQPARNSLCSYRDRPNSFVRVTSLNAWSNCGATMLWKHEVEADEACECFKVPRNCELIGGASQH